MASKVLTRPKTTAAKPATEVGAKGIGNGQTNAIEEEIRLLAYLKWEAAGKPAGDGLCYWVEAERELRLA